MLGPTEEGTGAVLRGCNYLIHVLNSVKAVTPRLTAEGLLLKQKGFYES